MKVAELAQQLARFVALAAFVAAIGLVSPWWIAMVAGAGTLYAHETAQHGIPGGLKFRRDVYVGLAGIVTGGIATWLL